MQRWLSSLLLVVVVVAAGAPARLVVWAGPHLRAPSASGPHKPNGEVTKHVDRVAKARVAPAPRFDAATFRSNDGPDGFAHHFCDVHGALFSAGEWRPDQRASIRRGCPRYAAPDDPPSIALRA